MNVPFFIARRYLFAKKSHNIINIISAISAIVIAFVTVAMVVVLSGFNGIENLVRSLYSTMDAPLAITAVKGKSFEAASLDRQKLLAIPGVIAVSGVIEDEVLIRYEGRQLAAVLKGVENNYSQIVQLDSARYEGTSALRRGKTPLAYMGAGLHYELEMPPLEHALPLEILALPKGNSLKRDREAALVPNPINAGGLFSVNADFDTRLVIVPIEFARGCFNYGTRLSSLEIKITGEDPAGVKDKVAELVGKDFKVTTREEKNEVVFKTSQTEKWVTFLILIFIVVIAAFNILASLTMLIIDKKRDLATLYSLGLTRSKLVSLFFFQSLLINAFGTLAGIVLGIAVCYLQVKYGLLELSGSVVEYYPVDVQLSDLLIIIMVMLLISMSSYFGVRYLISRHSAIQSHVS